MNNSGLPKLNLTASPKGPDQLATAAQPHPPERRNIAARLEALSAPPARLVRRPR